MFNNKEKSETHVTTQEIVEKTEIYDETESKGIDLEKNDIQEGTKRGLKTRHVSLL